MTLILLLLFFLIIWPLIRVAIAFYRAQQQARKAFGQFGRESSQQRTGRKAGWSGFQRQRKKKISRDMGEYVEFEEIVKTSTENTVNGDEASTEQKTEIEQQIVDVEWEDIK